MTRSLLKHEEYLTHLVEAVRKFGRDALTLVNYPATREFGFKTPENIEILLSLQELRMYFDAEDEAGPEGLPPDEVIRMHILMVEDAIAEGLRLRALH
jgi:hypothetical protein